MQLADQPKPHLGRVCGFLCALLLVAFAAAWGANLSEPYSLDHDEGVYLVSARMVALGHPLFTAVFSSQPPAFLNTLALAFRWFGDTVAVGRAVMVGFSVLALGAAAWIAWRLAGPLGGPVAILSLGLLSLLFRQARIVQAEMPALAWATLATAAVLAFRGTGRGAWLAAGGASFALGGLYKLSVAPMLAPLLFLLALASGPAAPARWRFLPADRTGVPEFGRRLLVFGLAGMLVTLAMLAFSDYAALYDQVVRFHLVMRQYFPRDRQRNLQLLASLLRPELGTLALAMAGLLALLRTNPLAASWLCLWVLSTVLFVMEHTPLAPQHLVLALPPLAVTAAASVLWIPRWWRRAWSRPLVFLLACPLVLAYGPGSRITWTLQRHAELLSETFPLGEQEDEAIRAIHRYTHATDYVVSDEQMQVFRAGRRMPPPLCDTSSARIKSGYLTDAQAVAASRPARMVIFWANRLVHLPGYREWVRSHFRLVQKFSDPRGWLKEIYVRDYGTSSDLQSGADGGEG